MVFFPTLWLLFGTLYSVIGDFLLILRLFKDVAFTFVGRKTLQICYVPNFGNKYETQMHGTAHIKIRKWEI
jgi:hypothetical protein